MFPARNTVFSFLLVYYYQRILCGKVHLPFTFEQNKLLPASHPIEVGAVYLRIEQFCHLFLWNAQTVTI